MSLQKKRKWHWGDRKDGRRLRTLEPLSCAIPFLMPERNESSNLCEIEIELSEIDEYVHKKRKEGLDFLSAMHILIAAYIRAVSQKPGVNRFVSGQRIFARNNIEINMEIKKEVALNAPATMMKFEFMPDATITDVYNQMNTKILEYKNAKEEENSFDKLVVFLINLPRFILRFIVWFLRWLDYHGWIPASLTKLSPFHGSLVITSMASLGIPSIYHHLYNFGNVPMFISFSTTRHEYKIDRDENVNRQHYLDINFTLDERVCDGQYYAEALREIKKYLKNPDLLDNPPQTVVEDID